MQMYLLLTSGPVIWAGRAANYRSCTLEPWVDMEPDHEHGNVSPKRMTSSLEKKKSLVCSYWSWAFCGLRLYGGETTAAAASSFGKGVRYSRGYGYSFVPETLEQQHCADVIGGSSGLGDGHILPDWGSLGRERMLSPMVSGKATRPVRAACKGARFTSRA